MKYTSAAVISNTSPTDKNMVANKI